MAADEQPVVELVRKRLALYVPTAAAAGIVNVTGDDGKLVSAGTSTKPCAGAGAI